MPAAHHDAEWPDKMMFAAQILLVAGGIGALFSSLLLAGLKTNFSNAPLLEILTKYYPPLIQLALSLATIVFGWLSLRQHVRRWAVMGMLTGIASFAALGLVPVLMIGVAVMLIKSRREGEETEDDGKTLEASVWPDKSISAAMFLYVTGVAAIFQGIFILIRHFDPVLLTGARYVAGSYDVAIGVGSIVAAYRVFQQKSEWMGWAFPLLGMATLSFYIVGPVLGMLALVMMILARKENEFEKHSAAAVQQELAKTARLQAKDARAAQKAKKAAPR